MENTDSLSRAPLSIAICEDDAVFREFIRDYIENYMQERRIGTTIATFATGEDLLAWEGVSTVKALFLDMELPGLNGYEAAHQMRDLNRDFVLVVISEFLEYAPAGYEVGAFRYALKDRLDASLDKSIEDMLLEIGYNRQQLEFDFVSGRGALYTDEIAYVEGKNHAAEFFGIWGDSLGRIYMKISDIGAVLPGEEFILSHKSYLVNMRHVDAFCDTHFVMKKSGEHVPVSQRRQPDVRKAYYMYTGKKPKRKGRKPKDALD